MVFFNTFLAMRTKCGSRLTSIYCNLYNMWLAIVFLNTRSREKMQLPRFARNVFKATSLLKPDLKSKRERSVPFYPEISRARTER